MEFILLFMSSLIGQEAITEKDKDCTGRVGIPCIDLHDDEYDQGCCKTITCGFTRFTCFVGFN